MHNNHNRAGSTEINSVQSPVPWNRPPKRPLPVSRPQISERAQVYVNDVLKSGWWGYGPVCHHLEQYLSEQQKEPVQALATSSCTSALHLSLLAGGIGPGDEVILTPFTYVATAAVIQYCGAKPVFADIDAENLMLSMESVRSLWTSSTKAVIAVHYAGQTGDFRELGLWCKQHGAVLIEDAAHALGSLDASGEPVGSHADFTAFSFAATKPVPSASGGLLFYKDPTLKPKISQLSMLGLTADTFQRFHHSQKLPEQVVNRLGYHYRSNDLSAAIALANVEEIASTRAHRQALVRRYIDLIAPMEQITTLPWPDGCEPNWYLMTVRVPASIRDILRILLKEDQIDTSVHYPSLCRHRSFAGCHSASKTSLESDQKVLSLPLFSTMELSDVDFVCAALQKALRTIENQDAAEQSGGHKVA